ncbi:MAG: hypothetical protein N2643_00720 [Endomicrobia bacterium]|nr:hypothetical protein [Endomicrobiia bacterium]
MRKNYLYKEFGHLFNKIVGENNIYFFYGPNNYYMLDIIDKICYSLSSVSKEIILGWEAKINDIATKLTTVDLFSSRTAVIIRYFEKTSKTFRKDILTFLKKYKIENYLFILYEKELLIKERDEHIRNFLENSISVQFPLLSKEEIIEDFIPNKFDIPLSYEVKEILWEDTGGDLWILSNELEKLKYFVMGKKEVSENDIKICCGEYNSPEIIALIESITKNEVYRKLDALNNLLLDRYSLVAIVTALYRYFRKNFLIKKINLKKAYNILKEIQYADYKIKTSSNPLYVVENCIIRISQIYNDL